MPTINQFDAILCFLSRFESPNFSPGIWQEEDRIIPHFEYDDTVSEFIQALYDNDWINPEFDWGEWHESARDFIDSPQRIKNTDLETIQKLFTTHVRADRFNEGHLAAMFENGHIVALLKRLSELRKQIGD